MRRGVPLWPPGLGRSGFIRHDTARFGRGERRAATRARPYKLDASADAALAQIKARGYHHAYLGQGLEIYLVGINFSSAAKEVEGWQIET